MSITQDPMQAQRRARRERFIAATVEQRLTDKGKRDALTVWHAVEQHPMTSIAAGELLDTWRQPYGLTVEEVTHAILAFLAARDPLTPVRAMIASLHEQAKSGIYSEQDDAAYFGRLKRCTSYISREISKPSTLTQLVDRAIVRRLASDVLAAGHSIAVYDGDEWTEKLTSLPAVMGAVMMASDEMLRVFAKGTQARLGTVVLVHHNAGYAVIDDHTQRPDFVELILGAVALAAAFCELSDCR